MIEVEGKYTSAKIYAQTIEEGLMPQILNALNHPIFKDCKVRIMPDCHIGKGCTIGFASLYVFLRCLDAEIIEDNKAIQNCNL